MTNNTNPLIYSGVGMTSAFGRFIQESLNSIAIWLLVVFCVIVCDLVMGLYRCYMTGEKIRPSRGLRDTMGKIAAYFSFVVVAVFAEKAFGYSSLDEIACGMIISGETISILGNYCKAHGYTLHVNKLLETTTERLGAKGVVTKDDED